MARPRGAAPPPLPGLHHSPPRSPCPPRASLAPASCRCVTRFFSPQKICQNGPTKKCRACGGCVRLPGGRVPERAQRRCPAQRPPAPPSAGGGAMFKRFTYDDVSSVSQVKSSVARGIRAKIAAQFPNLEPALDDVLPKVRLGWGGGERALRAPRSFPPARARARSCPSRARMRTHARRRGRMPASARHARGGSRRPSPERRWR